MKFDFTSVAEQVAQLIREGLEEGRWKKTVPGRIRLAEELGVNHKTVQRALNQLESEGLLKSQGAGRERLVVGHGGSEPKLLRVTILAYERSDFKSSIFQEILHRLQQAGHVASFANKTMTELGMSVKRVARFVEKADTDAWLVIAASQDVLNWFSTRPFPAFAFYGRASKIPIPSTAPKKSDALKELLEKLHTWGHRRIVYLAREEARKPKLGLFEKIYLEKLEDLGIITGTYNLPDWGDSPDDLRLGINALFQSTPPTAIILDDAVFFTALIQHLARLGISAPEQISLACTDHTSSFEWCRPKVTHIAWNSSVAVRRVVNWVSHLSRGKIDRRKTFIQAKLVMGGTTGPVVDRRS